MDFQIDGAEFDLPPDLPDPEELEEMEESERERLEAMLEAVTLAGSAEQVRNEVQELQRLAAQAQTVEDAGAEAKLSELGELLQKEGFFDHPDQRLLLFTEFKDTLDYLVGRLKSWGFRVGRIHGGMKSGSRDEPGTRLHANRPGNAARFRPGAIRLAQEQEGTSMIAKDRKRLAEVDFPVAGVSRHAARQKSIRHGDPGTLHLLRTDPQTEDNGRKG